MDFNKLKISTLTKKTSISSITSKSSVRGLSPKISSKNLENQIVTEDKGKESKKLTKSERRELQVQKD